LRRRQSQAELQAKQVEAESRSILASVEAVGAEFERRAESQRKFLDGIRWEVDILGKSREEVELMKAAQDGIDDAGITRLKQLQEERAIREEQLAIEKEFADLQKEMERERTRELQDGERLRESLMTADEKLFRQANQWRAMVQSGAISQGEFDQLLRREAEQFTANRQMPTTIRAGSVEALRAQYGERTNRVESLLQAIKEHTDPRNNQMIEFFGEGIA
jgi:hypothetical protein